jgi:hypothetical protein
VLTIRYSQRVEVEEVRQCVTTVRKLLGQLRPGFLLLTDLGNLKSMDPACAPELGAIMDLCSASGMATVVRVIPDPAKDIGFNVISLFHLDPKVKTRTCTSLAEAISSLLGEPSDEPAVDMTPIYGATVPSS